jgi:hypothetical protein
MDTESFRVVKPYCSFEVHRRFGGRYYVHIQRRRVIQRKTQQEAGETLIRNVDKPTKQHIISPTYYSSCVAG